MKKIENVIIGAGQSGLAMSYELARAGRDHIVLERGQAANSWRQERWESLRLLSPNWMNGLAGLPYQGPDKDGFMKNSEFIQQFEKAVVLNKTPIQSETTVLATQPHNDGYLVQTDQGAIACNTVISAVGACTTPKIPNIAAALPASVFQITPQQYKRPSNMPDGNVLVVGGSASGMQLARELQLSGRQVMLSVGSHLRFPRRYRGMDILAWMELMGTLSTPFDQVDSLDRVRRTPSLTLIGSDPAATIDLNTLQEIGVEIVGRLSDIRDNKALFSGSLHNECRAADLKMQRLLTSIDSWIAKKGLATLFPKLENIDAVNVPANPRLTLDLNGGTLKAVLWATGYRADLSWLNMPVFDRKSQLSHHGGFVQDGLYALGLPYLRTRKSTHIHGAPEDAKAIAKHIIDQPRRRLAA